MRRFPRFFSLLLLPSACLFRAGSFVVVVDANHKVEEFRFFFRFIFLDPLPNATGCTPCVALLVLVVLYIH